MENSKVLIFEIASVKNDLNNLHIGLEYLIIHKLILDDEPNFPITLKEIHVYMVIPNLQAINTIILHDEDDEDSDNNVIKNLRLPYGCKSFCFDQGLKPSYNSLKHVYYLKTEITKEIFKTETIGYKSHVRKLNGHYTLTQEEAHTVYGKFRKNKSKYNLRIYLK